MKRRGFLVALLGVPAAAKLGFHMERPVEYDPEDSIELHLEEHRRLLREMRRTTATPESVDEIVKSRLRLGL